MGDEDGEGSAEAAYPIIGDGERDAARATDMALPAASIVAIATATPVGEETSPSVDGGTGFSVKTEAGRRLHSGEIERGDEPDIGSGVAVACRKALVATFVQCGRAWVGIGRKRCAALLIRMLRPDCRGAC